MKKMEIDQQPRINPLDIELIVQIVLSCVDGFDLVNCRLVNKLWYQLATEQLRAKKWTVNLNSRNIAQYFEYVAAGAIVPEDNIPSSSRQCHLQQEQLNLTLTVGTSKRVNTEETLPGTLPGVNEALRLATRILQFSPNTVGFESIKVKCEPELDHVTFLNVLHETSDNLVEIELNGNLEAQTFPVPLNADVSSTRDSQSSLNLDFKFPKLATIQYNVDGSQVKAFTQIAANPNSVPALKKLVILRQFDEILNGIPDLVFNSLVELEIRLVDEWTLSALCNINFVHLKRLKIYQSKVLRLLGEFLSTTCTSLQRLEMCAELPKLPEGQAGPEYQLENFLENIPDVERITEFGCYSGPCTSENGDDSFDKQDYTRLGKFFRANLASASTKFQYMHSFSTNFSVIHAFTFLPEYFENSASTRNRIVFLSVRSLSVVLPVVRASDASMRIMNDLISVVFPSLEHLIVNIELPEDFWQWNSLHANIVCGYHKTILMQLVPLNGLRSVEVTNYYHDFLCDILKGGSEKVLDRMRDLKKLTLRSPKGSLRRPALGHKGHGPSQRIATGMGLGKRKSTGSLLANRLQPKVSLVVVLNKVPAMELIQVDKELLLREFVGAGASNGDTIEQMRNQLAAFRIQYPRFTVKLLE